MKVIHVEDFFDPTAGYQINELVNASSSIDDIYIITSKDMTPFHKQVSSQDDKKFEIDTGAKIIRLDSLYKLSSRLILKKLWKTIDEIEPDLLFLHGIGDFKDLILWRKKKPYKIVRDCHMSWVASRNKFRKIYYVFYKMFFSPVINKSRKYEKVFALGVEEYEYLQTLGINKNKIQYLTHGFNSSVMYFDARARNAVRSSYNITDEDILISYVGKFDESKRPDITFDILEKLEIPLLKEKRVHLLFFGQKNQTYMDFFEIKLNKFRKDINVIIEEAKPFSELKDYFSASDICIFPKETTLSSIHAQVCGSVVVMEKHKSNEERVLCNENLYNIGNIDEASKILARIILNDEYKKEKTLKLVNMLSHREYKNQIQTLKTVVRDL